MRTRVPDFPTIRFSDPGGKAKAKAKVKAKAEAGKVTSMTLEEFFRKAIASILRRNRAAEGSQFREVDARNWLTPQYAPMQGDGRSLVQLFRDACAAGIVTIPADARALGEAYAREHPGVREDTSLFVGCVQYLVEQGFLLQTRWLRNSRGQAIRRIAVAGMLPPRQPKSLEKKVTPAAASDMPF